MRRLITDRRGNVLAMSAAALVPLTAMIGGAIEFSRLCMTQTRLQQARDAVALAGRRAMSDVNALSIAGRTMFPVRDRAGQALTNRSGLSDAARRLCDTAHLGPV